VLRSTTDNFYNNVFYKISVVSISKIFEQIFSRAEKIFFFFFSNKSLDDYPHLCSPIYHIIMETTVFTAREFEAYVFVIEHVSYTCSAITEFSYPYCATTAQQPNLHCHKLQTGTSRIFQAVTANRVLRHNGFKCV